MNKITDYFPKKPGITAKELTAWKALRDLAGKTTGNILEQQTISVTGQRPGMTQPEKQALQGLYLLGKTTPRQVATKTLTKTYGKDRWSTFSEERKDKMINAELTRRQRENEKRFMEKLKTLRRMRETRLKKELDSLRDSPVRVAQPTRQQPIMTVQELGQRLRKLREKKTPTPPNIKKETVVKRHSLRMEPIKAKFTVFHSGLQEKLDAYKDKLEKTGRFTPGEVRLGLQRMETDALNDFYNAVLTQLDEELFTVRLGKLLGVSKNVLEKRYEIFLKEGHLPEIVSKKRKRTTTKKKKKADQDEGGGDDDDDGDVPEPIKKKRVIAV